MKIIQINCSEHWKDLNHLKFGFIINNRIHYLAGECGKLRPWDFQHYDVHFFNWYNLIYKD